VIERPSEIIGVSSVRKILELMVPKMTVVYDKFRLLKSLSDVQPKIGCDFEQGLCFSSEAQMGTQVFNHNGMHAQFAIPFRQSPNSIRVMCDADQGAADFSLATGCDLRHALPNA
jgi:hypothetical protein